MGVNQEQLKHRAEKSFDTLFNYPRNYVETYAAYKIHKQNPYANYKNIQELPALEKKAFELINQSGMILSPHLAELAIKQLTKAIKTYGRSASIEY